MIKGGIKKVKGAKAFTNLRRFSDNLSRRSVQAGYFDGKIHPSPRNSQRWTYAELMSFHEFQVESFTRRPLFTIASKNIQRNYSKLITPDFKRALNLAVTKGVTKPDKQLDNIGRNLLTEIDKVFGDTSQLTPNRPSTIAKKGFNSPMIETGALRDNLQYRVDVGKRKGAKKSL